MNITDSIDLKLAATELAAGREQLAFAWEMTGRARIEAIKHAIARLSLAARAIDTVVDRRTGAQP